MNSLALSLSNPGAMVDELPRFVTLEPVIPVETVSQATLVDIYRMFLRAQAGIPASTYRGDGCPIVFDGDLVRITLDFFAWPSAQDLAFELSSSIGDIGVAEIIELPRERDILFDMTDHHDLDFRALSVNLSWQTPCITVDGVSIAQPPLVIAGHRIALPMELFGVARLVATAWGHKYRLTIEVEKGDNRLTGLAPVVTAAWQDAEGKTETEQLELALPPCVEFALALCDGDLGNTYCSNRQRSINAYFSSCTSKLIAVIPGPDPESYCSDIAV